MRWLREFGRGFSLIIRDIHGFFYRRLGARIWWIYIGIVVIIFLWLTGQLWNLVFQVLTLVIVIGGLWLMVSSFFKRKKG